MTLFNLLSGLAMLGLAAANFLEKDYGSALGFVGGAGAYFMLALGDGRK